MDLNALKIFIKVVQAGSLTKASEYLAMPVPTVSRKIIELEKSLNKQLLDRSKQGVKPTILGQQLYEQVYVSMDNLLQATQENENAELSGLLRLSCFSATEWVWDWIAEFQDLYPKVKIHCYMTERTVDLMMDGIDVAFRSGDLQTDNLIAKPICQMYSKVVAHPNLLKQYGELKHPRDLQKFPCCSWASMGKSKIEWQFGQEKVEIPCYFSSNELNAIRHWATTGRAVAVLEQQMADRLIAQTDLVEVLSDYALPHYPIHLIYLAHRHPSSLVKAFVDFCVAKSQGSQA